MDESLKHTKKAKRKIVQLKDLGTIFSLLFNFSFLIEKCISEQDGLEFLTGIEETFLKMKIKEYTNVSRSLKE